MTVDVDMNKVELKTAFQYEVRHQEWAVPSRCNFDTTGEGQVSYRVGFQHMTGKKSSAFCLDKISGSFKTQISQANLSVIYPARALSRSS